MNVAIVGGGPAGLRAAEVAAAGGANVTIFDAKPSVGRKFLVAGRGGLNLTHNEPRDSFALRYKGHSTERWPDLLAGFDPDAIRAWAEGLGIETFAASTGRVYPREMKAAPLLRRWVERLRQLNVRFAMHHRWTGLEPGKPLRLSFQVQDETRTIETDAAILALGGGSWPDTGSDGKWTSAFEALDIAVAPLAPANCGWEYPWPHEVLAIAEGQPLKNIIARVGGVEAKGELMVTRYGLEGGAIYQLGAALRAAMPNPEITIDLKPQHTTEQLVAKMGSVRRDFLSEARQRWRLSEAVAAVLSIHEPFSSPLQLAAAAKAFTLRLTGSRPIAEAISSAGGVRWSELDAALMLQRIPGVFVAGEMIDWEAPTGGYLLQGCFATGTRAARGALEWLDLLHQ